MKNKSEKKSAEAKKTPIRPPTRAKANAKVASTAATSETTQKTKSAKPVKPPSTTPFDKKASSPLSKEAVLNPVPMASAIAEKTDQPKTGTGKHSSPATSFQQAPGSSPPAHFNPKPGKRPVRPSTARSEVKIPSLLLEGDQPPPPAVSGPGARYALAP